MMDESSARFHPKRRRSRGLNQPERRIEAKRLQYNSIQHSSSGEIDLRISSSCILIRNKSPPNNVSSGASSKTSFIRIYNQMLATELPLG
ncbi:unnamed protein product [Protopolystoma xenopodis]|uniref:Uncharacterized protein n=1 Tax=Protopolystoma xenopodis TaxID=117903 RepID=A0A448WA85_9PLAT|nr:unnamed protein product [Protopolystoma xenopodis]